MADCKESGNDWEVVSLTASTYAASPGPKEIELTDDDKSTVPGEDEPETSNGLFMSRHFVFLPNRDNNSSPELSSLNIAEKQKGEDGFAQLDAEVSRYRVKDETEWAFKEKTLSDEFPGMQFISEKDNILPVHNTEFEEGKSVQDFGLTDKEQSLYDATFSSLHGDPAFGLPTALGKDTITSDVVGTSEDHPDSSSDALHSPKAIKDDNSHGSSLPCGAWWKRRAASLYAQAKEANAFWSVFIAAAVMGFVIMGHRWRHERWQALQLKWHVNISNENTNEAQAFLLTL
ncbi:ATG8-interacting protein 2-like isoform X2 [Syzygium oleosum]|uniref:ATG8-interacting protein 2-like isoform X2 n=1 Tax=Syzygium oleosum TaxID=219896 RepID=UPI0024B93832|nr:ATG8-interacting protein 2-like isoform X2 [Syzygium oleosum]